MLIIAPCRSLCLAVRTGCEPVLARFNLYWPDELDCSNLPDPLTDRQNLCIDIPASAAASAIETEYERQLTGQSASEVHNTDTSNGLAETVGVSARQGDDDGQVPGSVAQNGEWLRSLGSLRRLHSPSISQTILSHEVYMATQNYYVKFN